MSVRLRAREGGVRLLPVHDWCAPASEGERELLAGLRGPVLDLGCGPARLVVALGQLGIPALGVDASPRAIGRALERDAPALQRSVFEPLPGEGRWPSVLLFDGNVGIGGDPIVLLSRVAALISDDGVAIVEVEPPGAPTTITHARLERDDERTTWFPWAWVGADAMDEIAVRAGLTRRRWLRHDQRWFAELAKSRP
jgi:SAM-dependent methyltransferase